ncbi:MAG: DUF3006 family protein [Candidatus Falkowbacteria bacterium]|nr:DUF3006 family protein [Candidatus Falkowbacteria bacterium]
MVIELKVEKLENDKAILKSEDNDTIVWPKSKLPKDVKEGSLLAFSIRRAEEKDQDNKELAKDILNEILDVNEKEKSL